jgi:flagellar biosynthesis protein FlhA
VKAHQLRAEVTGPAEAKADAAGAPTSNESLDALLKLDELSIEIGHALVPMVDGAQHGQLLSRIRSVRKHLSVQFGFVVPAVHITDNLRLKPREYVIQLRGVEIARWHTQDDCLLAISSDPNPSPLPGVDTVDPAFGVGAKWIPPSLREQALAIGYAVVDQTSVIATHLAEVIRAHAHELLSRSETKRLLDKVGEAQPKLVEELVPKLLSLGEVQRVLQQLLREQVSIRDLTSVLESLIETAAVTKNIVVLVEAARQALSRALVRPWLAEDGALRVITLESALEDELSRAFNDSAASSTALAAPFLRRVLESLRTLVGAGAHAATPVLLCATPARYHLRRMLEPFLPKIVVLSPLEIPPNVTVSSIAMVR